MSRWSIVAFALEEVGNTDPSRYWLRVLDPPRACPRDAKGRPLSWCGACCLYILQQAGHALNLKWKPGKGFGLKVTKQHPEIGDVAYRVKNQHYATVVDVGMFPVPWVSTVDGNSSETDENGVVRTGVVVLHERTPTAKWDAFFDIETFL